MTVDIFKSAQHSVVGLTPHILQKWAPMTFDAQMKAQKRAHSKWIESYACLR